MVLKALQCGKHVLCEKPLALSDKETSEMIQAARASPHLVCQPPLSDVGALYISLLRVDRVFVVVNY